MRTRHDLHDAGTDMRESLVGKREEKSRIEYETISQRILRRVTEDERHGISLPSCHDDVHTDAS